MIFRNIAVSAPLTLYYGFSLLALAPQRNCELLAGAIRGLFLLCDRAYPMCHVLNAECVMERTPSFSLQLMDYWLKNSSLIPYLWEISQTVWIRRVSRKIAPTHFSFFIKFTIGNTDFSSVVLKESRFFLWEMVTINGPNFLKFLIQWNWSRINKVVTSESQMGLMEVVHALLCVTQWLLLPC